MEVQQMKVQVKEEKAKRHVCISLFLVMNIVANNVLAWHYKLNLVFQKTIFVARTSSLVLGKIKSLLVLRTL